MRTTINISERVYRDAKARAALSGQTVSQVIEDAVRQALRADQETSVPAAPLPTFGGSGVLPGIDLADMSALINGMDEGAVLDALR